MVEKALETLSARPLTLSAPCRPLPLQFSLLNGFYEWMTSREEIKLLMVGLERAGKTTLLEQLKIAYVKGHRGVSLSAIPSTIGMNLGKFPLANTLDITLWDLGGSMRGIWDQYYGEADGLLFVIDGSERARFGEAASALATMLARKETSGLPLLVAVNKKDKADCARTPEIMEQICRPAGLGAGASNTLVISPGASSVSSSTSASTGATAVGASAGTAAAAATRREYRIMEVCGVTGEGIREGIEWLVRVSKEARTAAAAGGAAT